MQIIRGFQYRIYPNKKQQELIIKTFGCCRFIYNQMLADKIDYYEETKSVLNNTPAQYKTEFEWLKEVDSMALCNVQMNLQAAFNKFFNEPNVGFPKFKSKKGARRAYKTSTVGTNIRLVDGKYIQLPKLSKVKIRLSRDLPEGYVIKNVTVFQDVDDKYFVSICVQYETKETESQPIKTAIGLDYSSPHLYVDSNNESPDITHWTRELADKLAREQRKLSRCEYGSNNYYKQLRKVNKVHAKIKRCRKDQLNKLSTELANKYDLIVIEDLDMKAMSQTLRLGKSTMDNGFGMFRDMLGYKLADRGKYLVKVDRFFASTKTCNECGTINKDITLGTRQRTCPSCGVVHDRDYNAAKNILDEGLRIMKGRAYPDSLFMLETEVSSSKKVSCSLSRDQANPACKKCIRR